MTIYGGSKDGLSKGGKVGSTWIADVAPPLLPL